MKPRTASQTNHAMTLVEVLLVITVLAILASILLPALISRPPHHGHVNCVGNLKQIGLAYQVWSGDNGDKYPMGISVTNGGSMELVSTGNVFATFLLMSNELGTPKILHCPEDAEHLGASSFDQFTSSNISYFIGVDVSNRANPLTVLSGDDNFQVGGFPVKSGLQELWTNTPFSWSSARHKKMGNLAMADGRVQQVTQIGLREAFQQTGVPTNRLAIP